MLWKSSWPAVSLELRVCFCPGSMSCKPGCMDGAPAHCCCWSLQQEALDPLLRFLAGRLGGSHLGLTKWFDVIMATDLQVPAKLLILLLLSSYFQTVLGRSFVVSSLHILNSKLLENLETLKFQIPFDRRLTDGHSLKYVCRDMRTPSKRRAKVHRSHFWRTTWKNPKSWRFEES